MRRLGFTIIELTIALSISAILLASFGGLLTSIWIMAKESTDELQCIVRAESSRQKLFYRLTDVKGNLWPQKDGEGNVRKDENGEVMGVGGLLSATSILFKDGGAIEAEFTNADSWTVDLSQGSAVEYFGLDASRRKASDYRQPKDNKSLSLQYIHLKIPIGGKTAYYDTLRIPTFLKDPLTAEKLSLEDFIEIFGGAK